MRTAPREDVPLGESCFIESLGDNNKPIHSCSFIEFDGRGDYADFEQHRHAWKKVRELASRQQLVLVFYCHGWKNNSQSDDVVKFNDFLGRLASSTVISAFNYRVHGVYLGWRGNLYRPYIDKAVGSAYDRTCTRFGDPIVSSKWDRRFRWVYRLQENFSYWSRLHAAADNVSGIPMARSVYQCATLLKSIDQQQGRKIGSLTSSRVLVMGHSFGSLVLERALYATCLDPLMTEWSWFQRSADSQAAAPPHPNPLPIDFILFVNSAAPSLYAKAMQDFLAAHQSAMENGKSPIAFAPILISITSSADWATRYAHPAANLLAGFYPSLQRVYTDLLKVKGTCKVKQSWFFRRTPGHQPFLVDHWLDKSPSPPVSPKDLNEALDDNLDYQSADALTFWAHTSGDNGELARWQLTREPNGPEHLWATRFGNLKPSRSSYWVVRCDKRIIRDHSDVWSDTTMEVYAAFYRLVEWARNPNNGSNQVLDKYWARQVSGPRAPGTQV